MQIDENNLNTFLRMTTGELISFILGIVAESCNKKITDELKAGWSLTLTGIPNHYLIKGFQILMKEKTDNFMPHPGELRGICKGIQIANHREKRLDNENQTLIDYSNVPQIAHEAAKISEKLDINAEPKRVFKRPTLILYDTINPETGDVKKVSCSEHVDQEYFAEQCAIVHRVKPLTVRHAFHKWHKFKHKDNNGNLKNSSMGFVECEGIEKGAEPITVGYF